MYACRCSALKLTQCQAQNRPHWLVQPQPNSALRLAVVCSKLWYLIHNLFFVIILSKTCINSFYGWLLGLVYFDGLKKPYTLIGCVSDLQQSHSYLHNGICMNLMSYLMSYRIATLDHAWHNHDIKACMHLIRTIPISNHKTSKPTNLVFVSVCVCVCFPTLNQLIAWIQTFSSSFIFIAI